MSRLALTSAAVLLAVLSLAPAGSQKAPPPRPDLDGRLCASRVVVVAAPIDGLLEQVTCEVGDVIAAGKEIAQLDTRMQEIESRIAAARAERTSDLERARAAIADVTRRLERRSQLYAEGLLADAERDDLLTRRRLAEIDLAAAEESHALAQIEHERALAELDRARVRSPIAGVVTKRFLSGGEAVTRNSPGIIELAALDPLEVEVVVPVEQLRDIAVGGAARVFPETGAPEGLAARIKSIEREVDTASATFLARLELPNPKLELPAGLRCRVRLER